MKSFVERERDIATNHRIESTAFGENAHVNVDHEIGDGDESGDGMEEYGDIAEPAQAPPPAVKFKARRGTGGRTGREIQ